MARDLSPFSARRLLTQQLAQEKRSRSRSRSRERTSRNRLSPEPYRKQRQGPASPDSGKRDRHHDRRRGNAHDPRDDGRHRSRERRRDGSHGKESASASEDRQHGRHSRRGRSRSPQDTSPPPKRRRRSPSSSRHRAPSPHQRTKKPLPSQQVSFRGLDDSAQPPSKYGGAPPDKEKPNFKPTGLLAKAANRVQGTKISLKYNEPPEARKSPPSRPWRIFVFKGPDVVDTIEIWRKSCWLLGRSQEVVDYVLEHPSSSGQHAVIQFRYIQKTIEDEFGVKSKRGSVKPYIIDLESSNGTELNGESVEASRYFELRDKDILKFAGSEREYVVMLPPSEE
jgi:smad nuclear-interacting protein 1